MKISWFGASLVLFLALGMPGISAGEDDLGQQAASLYEAREDLGSAEKAIRAYEALLKASPGDYEILLRLSRLHYWIGQNLEGADDGKARFHYEKGGEYGKDAAKASPEKPGGYFFEAANLARENNLKGTFSNLWGISTVRRLNEKTASIAPDYFYGGPDRFFCALYAKLPGLLGGSTSKAIDHGKRAAAAFPDYAGNRYFLAEAYYKDGRNDLARKELEAAVAALDAAYPDVIPEQRMEKKRAEELLKKIGK